MQVHVSMKSNKTDAEKILAAQVIARNGNVVFMFGEDSFFDKSRLKVELEMTGNGIYRVKSARDDKTWLQFYSVSTHTKEVMLNKEMFAAICMRLGVNELKVGDNTYTFDVSSYVIRPTIVVKQQKTESTALAELLVAGINYMASTQKKKYH